MAKAKRTKKELDCDPEEEDCPPIVKKASAWIKLAVGIFTLISIISLGIWTTTTTFATKTETKIEIARVAKEAEDRDLVIAQKAVETFEIFQKSYKKDQEGLRQEQKSAKVKADIRYWQQQLDDSFDREREISNSLITNPNDTYLRNKLADERRKQQLYRNKLSDLLR